MKRWPPHARCKQAGTAFVTTCVALLCLQAASAAEEKSDILPDPSLRVSFDQHGGDWTQGNCGSRNLQSPININELYVPPTGGFEYRYRTLRYESFKLYNDGRAIYADMQGKDVGGIAIPHATVPWYDLQRIDIHSPAEHTFRGKRSPLEIQLVHAPKAGYPGKQLVTISILFETEKPLRWRKLQPMTWPGLLQQGNLDEESPDYEKPYEFAKDFDPTLQAFVRQEPPIFDTSVKAEIPKTHPFDIGNWMVNGSFAMYRGSQTLPPCDERVLWLVRREPIPASIAQVHALFAELDSTSLGSGNYRTVMPRNQRPVEFWTARKRVPPLPTPPPPPVAAMSRDAITIAKAASDYARELDLHLSRAAAAQAKGFQASPTALSASFKPSSLNATAPAPSGEIWAAKQIAGFVTRALHDAVAEDLKEVMPAATNLAIGYLRRDLLKKSGFKSMPSTTTSPPPVTTRKEGARPEVVVFSFTVLNVDYTLLTANPTTTLAFQNAIKESIVDGVQGITLTLEDVALALKPGSVVVEATVTVPATVTSATAQSSIASSSIAATMTTALVASPEIAAVSPGGQPFVGSLSPPMVKLGAPLPPAPTPAPALANSRGSKSASSLPAAGSNQPPGAAGAVVPASGTPAASASSNVPASAPAMSPAPAPAPVVPLAPGPALFVASPTPAAPAPAPGPVPAPVPAPLPAQAPAPIRASAPAPAEVAAAPLAPAPAQASAPAPSSPTLAPAPAPEPSAETVSMASIGADILAGIGGHAPTLLQVGRVLPSTATALRQRRLRTTQAASDTLQGSTQIGA